MAELATSSAITFVQESLHCHLDLLQQATRHFVNALWIQTGVGRASSSVQPLINTRVQFPQEIPSEYGKGLVLLDGRIPALPLSKQLYEQLETSNSEVLRQQRVEEIHSIHYDKIQDVCRRLHAVEQYSRRRREMIVSALEEFEADGPQPGAPVYTWDQVDHLDSEITKAREAFEKFRDDMKIVQEHLSVERKDTFLHNLQAAHMLQQHFAASGLGPSAKERSLGQRRSLGWHMQHLYKQTHLKPFLFAQQHVDKEWPRPNKNASAKNSDHSSISESLASAIDAFDVTHWNRLVAREDFQFMEELSRDRQRSWMQNITLEDFYAYQDQMHEGLAEKGRLTRNLVRAEEDYRHAVRRLREKGQSVATADSTHLSTISTRSPSIDDQFTTMMKNRHDKWVDAWRLGLHDTTITTRSRSEIVTDVSSIHLGSGRSQLNGCMGGTEQEAIKKRAWRRERANRNRRALTHRRRNGSPGPSVTSSTAKRIQDGKKPPAVRARQHLSGYRKGRWPLGNPPIKNPQALRRRDEKSFSSGIGRGVD